MFVCEKCHGILISKPKLLVFCFVLSIPNYFLGLIQVRLTFDFTFLKEWGGQQKKANRSSEKNKKKFGVASDKRVTNDISPESSPGVGRRRTKIPHTFPHSRYMTQMSVPEQAELEKLKQRINFSDLDQVCELFSE